MGAKMRYDFTGKTFDNWVVVERIYDIPRKHRIPQWLCKCTKCGNEKVVLTSTLKNGMKKTFCKRCVDMERRPEIYAYLKYHPKESIPSDGVIFHLDGDINNNKKDNLFLTTNNKIHYADLKLAPNMSMYSKRPELAGVRKTVLMLIDLERVILSKENVTGGNNG